MSQHLKLATETFAEPQDMVEVIQARRKNMYLILTQKGTVFQPSNHMTRIKYCSQVSISQVLN